MYFARLCGFARGFRRERSGTVVVLFAAVATVVIAGAGLATDMILAYRLRTVVQGVLDEASLAGAKVGIDYLIKNPGMDSNAQSLAQARALSFFTASMSVSGGLTRGVTMGTPTFVVDTVKGSVTVSASLNMVQPVNLLRVMGKQNMAINVKSVANVGAPSYSNFTLMLDVSQSMGIAAGPTEMNLLYNTLKAKWGIGCVFACHAVSGEYPVDTYVFAKENNIPLRMDSLRNAVKMLLADAQGSAAGSFMTFSFYTMGIGLTRLTKPTNNYTYLKTLANGLDIEPSEPVGAADSYLNEGLQSIVKAIPKSGTGLSSSSRKQYALLVSDGLYDTWGPDCNWSHCTGPIDTSICQTLKDKGVTVFVVYTTYYPIYNDPTNPASGYDIRYLAMAIDQQPKIAPAMQACATSPEHYFEAGDTATMNSAFKQIFYKLQNVTLTN